MKEKKAFQFEEQDFINMEERGALAAQVTIPGERFRELLRLARLGFAITEPDWKGDDE
jgi:hypothetical protein